MKTGRIGVMGMKMGCFRALCGSILPLLLAGAVSAQTDVSGQTTEAPAKMPFMNPCLPADQRIEDLLHRMTLEEKASQLVISRARFRGWGFRRTTGGVKRCTA